MLLREAAGELTIAPDAVDRERGVVLSEERTRDSPGYRVAIKTFGFQMEGQLPPKRIPIGKTEILKTAPAQRSATSTRPITVPSGRCSWRSATSTSTPWKPRSRPSSATGRPRARRA
jgi:hypothetical protein